MTNRYNEDFGPNVLQIQLGATRVIRGKMPSQVRRELMAAVKAGVLGRLKKDGLKPEVFFHPDHKSGAVDRQKREALYNVQCVASVLVTPAQFRDDLTAQGIDPLDYAFSERAA